ncbi:hypothetical protein GCM10010116_55950 [Microbispora rosea subsp. aerata]|nr:hypothetical protein [Microbispora rosea]GGO27908.1 hypothetical protein GCM10010116_55950 [Microbispora rosea subsp. aerata]GIH56977.1 hypothetical protein Mro02_38910 [Microbispora rosea subsp. aerata]GLJ82904.1 hypothetical protein GCM10017588_16300 [Microbispora rosea subsp. aerata]
MLVVLVIAGLAVIACVVMVSLGHGGEMAEFPPDVPPLDLPEAGQMTPADLIALQLPIGLVGYSTQAVDETLHRVSLALGERDTRIAVLEQRVAELSYARPQPREETNHAEPAQAETTQTKTAQTESAQAKGEPEVSAAAAREGWDGDHADAEETW